MDAQYDGGITLVVEDDPENRRLLARLLQRDGLLVESAGTVAGALEKLANSPRVVLLDMRLPDGTGADVLREIRRAERPTAVAVLTGWPEPETLDELRGFAPDAVFLKPFDIEKLCAWVWSMQVRPNLEPLAANAS